MMENKRDKWLAVLLGGMLFAGVGCAGSESSTADDEEATASETRSEESRGGGSQGSTKAIQKRIHFEDILGTSIPSGQKPSGCEGSWDAIDKDRYPGDTYFCGKFNGPEQWGESPVTFAIRDGELSLIAVQIFYDGVEKAKDEYQDFASSLLDRCERKTGFDRNVVLDCGDYFMDVSWQGHHETGQMEVIYAVEFEDLRK